MKKIVFILSMFLLCSCLSGCASSIKGSGKVSGEYVVLLGEEADVIDQISDVKLLIIDGEYFTKEDVDALKANGVEKIYSYFNVGSLETFRDYYEEFELYTLGDYENWPEERWIDVSNEAWQNSLKERADLLLQKGFDGFFIDNTDVYYYYPEEQIYEGLVEILGDLHQNGKTVLINGGDAFVKRYLDSDSEVRIFDGVNQENIYTRYDFDNRIYEQNPEEEREYFEEYLDFVLQNDYLAYVLEYAPDEKIAKAAYEYDSQKGYICYVADNIELRQNH